MNELNESRVAVGIHAVTGVLAGYVSMFFSDILYSVGLGIIILIVTGYGVEFLLKKKGIKWWMSNGGLLFILAWIATWIFFFNLA